ncbi:hypothetical protein N7457_005948 [Penicillium paradoxum]|uniref:uncharacterized protein n=1 Tax=Penicillium paradoxum TaxID=176176 RepID=UPI002549AE1E|nr:uncharacterized protein N7457_005948 [Penicillium paradoxum]KAJ5780788.1 hypothetical protein N7457_005948 [Penicillium paradoxum]
MDFCSSLSPDWVENLIPTYNQEFSSIRRKLERQIASLTNHPGDRQIVSERLEQLVKLMPKIKRLQANISEHFPDHSFNVSETSGGSDDAVSPEWDSMENILLELSERLMICSGTEDWVADRLRDILKRL